MDAAQLSKNFQETTGSDPDTAKFFLESSNYDIQQAISNFYDSNGHVPQNAQIQKTNSTPVSQTNSGIKTFSDLNSNQDGDDSDEDDTNSYFAGGEKSGQMVQAPKSDAEIRNQNWERAENSKARVESHDQDTTFSGSGQTLGSQNSTPLAVNNRRNDPVVIHFYNNGFTVENGPFRSFQDPSNLNFLNDINNGKVPTELERWAREQGIESQLKVSLEQHSEDYKEPPKTVSPFAGQGQTLGRTPSVNSEKPVAVVQNNVATGSPLQVDESQPVTRIQIRLHDGSRLVAKFNHSHTIGDIKKHIADTKPSGNFTLSTSFPPALLTDESQTISDAGLINAVVVQKLK